MSNRRPSRTAIISLLAPLMAALVVVCVSPMAMALDEAHYKTARGAIDRAVAFLRAGQDETTGGWSVPKEGPALPAITALVVTGMLMEPDIDASDPAVARGLDYILSFRQPDGGIYDRILANYNTAICLSALARANRTEAAQAIQPAQQFLTSIQWSRETKQSPDSPTDVARVGPDNPFYGGVGYGRHGRPDNSNLNMMLQGLRDSGLSCDDPAFVRALVFLQRTQMHESVNDMPYAKGSRQGGFIYATGPDPEHATQGESKAGLIDEKLDDGRTVSRLRCYGSMTYAGFKSYLYANLDHDDPRVRLAYDWIRRNYSLEENPGVGEQGLYYYYVTFARAMDAWGMPTIQTLNADGSTDQTRDWANDLIDKLATLQNQDGSFKNAHDRWMEGDPSLVTAYALLALQHAID